MIRDKQPVPLYIPWTGGPCPVDEHTFPQVITADGGQDCERASDLQWEWSDEYPADNVIAYRASETVVTSPAEDLRAALLSMIGRMEEEDRRPKQPLMLFATSEKQAERMRSYFPGVDVRLYPELPEGDA